MRAARARYASAVVAAHAADALYERGELAEAEERLRDALDLGDDFSWLGATGSAPPVLARLPSGLRSAERGRVRRWCRRAMLFEACLPRSLELARRRRAQLSGDAKIR